MKIKIVKFFEIQSITPLSLYSVPPDVGHYG